jgi:hypothetical protein
MDRIGRFALAIGVWKGWKYYRVIGRSKNRQCNGQKKKEKMTSNNKENSMLKTTACAKWNHNSMCELWCSGRVSIS